MQRVINVRACFLRVRKWVCVFCMRLGVCWRLGGVRHGCVFVRVRFGWVLGYVDMCGSGWVSIWLRKNEKNGKGLLLQFASEEAVRTTCYNSEDKYPRSGITSCLVTHALVI